MLNALSKKSERVCGSNSCSAEKKDFFLQKKEAAEKLKNPRLFKITFHTFRHWKATMLYHQTKDIIRVQRFLGHKKIENTMIYIQLAENLFKETSDGFAVKVATKPNEIKGLLEVGFEYVCQRDGLMFFRKRK